MPEISVPHADKARHIPCHGSLVENQPLATIVVKGPSGVMAGPRGEEGKVPGR
jgi:hypothetical protein